MGASGATSDRSSRKLRQHAFRRLDYSSEIKSAWKEHEAGVWKDVIGYGFFFFVGSQVLVASRPLKGIWAQVARCSL